MTFTRRAKTGLFLRIEGCDLDAGLCGDFLQYMEVDVVECCAYGYACIVCLNFTQRESTMTVARLLVSED